MLDLIFRWFDLVTTSITQDMIKILHRGQEGHALSQGLVKPTFPLFYVLNWVSM